MLFDVQPTLESKLKMCGGIISGMNFLHTRNPPIIHGDLKIENVVVGKGYVAKVDLRLLIELG